MYRKCPKCGAHITAKDIFRPGFRGKGEAVKCGSCNSVISQPWSDFSVLRWSGLGISGILGIVGWRLQDGFGGRDSAYWLFYVAAFVLAMAVSFAVLYAFFPLEVAPEGEKRKNNNTTDESAGLTETRAAVPTPNNLSPSGEELYPIITSPGQLFTRISLLILLISLIFGAFYLLVFRQAFVSALIVVIACGPTHPDILLKRPFTKALVITSLLSFAVVFAF